MASIREALETGLKTLATAQQPTRRKPAHDEGQEPAAWRNTLQAAIGGVNDKLQTLIQAVREQGASAAAAAQGQTAHKNVDTLVGMLDEQFQTMQMWLAPVVKSEEGRGEYVQQLLDRFESMVSGYNRLIGVLKAKYSAPTQGDAANDATEGN